MMHELKSGSFTVFRNQTIYPQYDVNKSVDNYVDKIVDNSITNCKSILKYTYNFFSF